MSRFVAKVARRLAAEWREFRRWEALRHPEDLRVYYGMDPLPGRTEPVSGGIVKIMDLAEQFPNSIAKANLLYLVSSALPDRRELLARAAQRAGGCFVLNQNGVAYPAWAGETWSAQNAPNARVHAMADYVVYQSEFCRRCAERFLGPRKGPESVLYNPVNTEVFVPREGFDQSDRVPKLLVAGSHHEAYRVQLAIEALAIVRRRVEVRLLVAGRLLWNARAEEEARRWALEAGVADAVEFSGPYSQEGAPALFHGADALVHLKVQDPCPRLAVEAMACGVPVVYSATGGTAELVGDEAGCGIPGSEDFETIRIPAAEETARAIVRVLTDRETYARQARIRAERDFGAHAWVEAHAHIFETLARGRGL